MNPTAPPPAASAGRLRSVRILHGVSHYGVFAAWQRSLADAFRAQGVAARVIPVQDERPGADDGELGVGFNLVRKWSADHNANRHLAWLVDHPVYHPELFMPEFSGIPLNPAACAVACADEGWADYARNVYDFPHVFFLPHFCSATVFAPPGGPRENEAVFFGSIADPESFLRSLERDAGPLWPAIRESLEAYEALRPAPPLDAFLLDRFRPLTPDRVQTRIFMNAFFPALDGYVRCRGRLRLLQGLRHARVHVYGDGPWPRFSLPPNIVLHGPIPFDRVPAVLARAGVLLNHTPTLGRGAHERIFEALAAGCPVCTTPSVFLGADFGPDTGVVFYDPENPGALDDRLAALPEDGAAAERVRAGQALAAERHTASARARAIADLYARRWPPSDPPLEETIP